MRKFLFLISWVHGSDSDCSDEGSGINSSADLLPGYKAGNENVKDLKIESLDSSLAASIGFHKAFFLNYTAKDSVSAIYEWIDGEWQNCKG